jgi:hypothetical protein
MSAENAYTIEEFSITPLKSGINNIDISSNSVAQFEYYEDILSPTVTAKVTFAIVDIANLPQGFDIYGGEKFNILLSVEGSTKKLILNDNLRNLHVRSVSANKNSASGIYSVELVSKETLTNETVRVVNRYDGKLDESAKNIFNQLKSQKQFVGENTANKYSFISNTRRPFDLLVWLCPKSVPPGKRGFGTAGYLFFETQDGYYFQSVDKLITQESSFTYEQTEKIQAFDRNSKFRILASNVVKNNDILNSLRMGMYANNSLFYNLYTNQTKRVEYKLSAKYTDLSKSSESSDYPKLPLGIENFPSRYLVRSLDAGSFSVAGVVENLENLPKYQAEAAVRYNLLFSQVLNITIPCNLDLRVGQVIECRIPESTADPTNKKFESQHSGKYMIANLCHSFKGNQCFTFLSLVRDSYEIKTGVS